MSQTHPASAPNPALGADYEVRPLKSNTLAIRRLTQSSITPSRAGARAGRPAQTTEKSHGPRVTNDGTVGIELESDLNLKSKLEAWEAKHGHEEDILIKMQGQVQRHLQEQANSARANANGEQPKAVPGRAGGAVMIEETTRVPAGVSSRQPAGGSSAEVEEAGENEPDPVPPLERW